MTFVWILIGTLTLTTLFDIVTALRVPLLEMMETNPVYRLTGNFSILIILNIIAIVYFFYTLWKKISLGRVFVATLAVFLLSFGHIVGGLTNIIATQNYNEDPGVYTEHITKTTETAKISWYALLISIFILFPYILGILAFYVSLKLHEYNIPEREKVVCEALRVLELLK
jgi:hypothetical protein